MKKTKDLGGGTKLTNFRVEVRATLSKDRSAGSCHCSFVELSSNPASLTEEGTKSKISINLANMVFSALVVP